MNTNEPCDVDPSSHITGVVGNVLLAKPVCKNKTWHVITYDFSNPNKPIVLEDVDTRSQECDTSPIDNPENAKMVTELKCINDYYYMVNYLVYPDGAKRTIEGLIPTLVKCKEALNRPFVEKTINNVNEDESDEVKVKAPTDFKIMQGDD